MNRIIEPEQLKTLQQVYEQLETDKKERFASVFDYGYPDIAKWVRENGIPKQILVPEGYVANVESIQPLVTSLERWGIEVVKTQLIRQAIICFVSEKATKIDVDLSYSAR